MADTEIPALLRESTANGLAYQRKVVRDWTEAIKEKAIADRSCSTWDETIDEFVKRVRLYERFIMSAKQYAPEALEAGEDDI